MKSHNSKIQMQARRVCQIWDATGTQTKLQKQSFLSFVCRQKNFVHFVCRQRNFVHQKQPFFQKLNFFQQTQEVGSARLCLSTKELRTFQPPFKTLKLLPLVKVTLRGRFSKLLPSVKVRVAKRIFPRRSRPLQGEGKAFEQATKIQPPFNVASPFRKGIGFSYQATLCLKNRFSNPRTSLKLYANPAFRESVYSPLTQFKIPDFLNIQRLSFQKFLSEGLIKEFERYNRISNSNQTFEIFFYADQYKLNRPKWTPKQAVLKRKSYSCQLYLPVQISDPRRLENQLQWVLLANLPLMTKHGHFIINGCPRVLMNQMVRSPGVYFQKIEKRNKKTVYCADFIAQRGSWLRLEVDTRKGDIWAKLKRTPKIPVFVLLRALGLSLPVLHQSIDFERFYYLSHVRRGRSTSSLIRSRVKTQTGFHSWETPELSELFVYLKGLMFPRVGSKKYEKFFPVRPPKNWSDTFACPTYFTSLLELTAHVSTMTIGSPFLAHKFLFRKFQNLRTYDLSLLGRLRINKKLGLCIPPDHTVLTAQDVLVACLFLIDLLQGLVISDDIDDLRNRKIKPAGELIQIQLATGLIRLDKLIRERLELSPDPLTEIQEKLKLPPDPLTEIRKKVKLPPYTLTEISDFLTALPVKPLNQCFREFFGSSPLSQFMDQTNALAELTHKRRLSALGPGGISRETAGMAIRGIHPTHYGRICPIETPEGQNAGLVNSFTVYAHLNTNGFIETPFYKTYKGFILKNQNPLLFASDQELNWVLAPGDIQTSRFNFLPDRISLPARQLKEFQRVSRNDIDFSSMSPIQMISVATSLIPFLEHNDGNRALMGSNMQRQAVPTLRLCKPIVGTGLESRVIADVGHAPQVKYSGYVSYVDGNKIVIYSNNARWKGPFLKPLKTNGSSPVSQTAWQAPQKLVKLNKTNRSFFKKRLTVERDFVPLSELHSVQSSEGRESSFNLVHDQPSFTFKACKSFIFRYKDFWSTRFKSTLDPVTDQRKNNLGCTPFAFDRRSKVELLPKVKATVFESPYEVPFTEGKSNPQTFTEGKSNPQTFIEDKSNPPGTILSGTILSVGTTLRYTASSLPEEDSSFFWITPFQSDFKKRNLNTKEQNFFYNQFFLNDFLGQLEFKAIFSKKLSYSKLSKTFQPFFPKRAVALLTQSFHQKLMVSYGRLILVHFYKKLNPQGNRNTAPKTLAFDKLIQKYEKSSFLRKEVFPSSRPHKSQKGNPFWYRSFDQPSSCFVDKQSQNFSLSLKRRKKKRSSLLFCFLKRERMGQRSTHEKMETSLFLIWCFNFCKLRKKKSSLTSLDLRSSDYFNPPPFKKRIQKKLSQNSLTHLLFGQNPPDLQGSKKQKLQKTSKEFIKTFLNFASVELSAEIFSEFIPKEKRRLELGKIVVPPLARKNSVVPTAALSTRSSDKSVQPSGWNNLSELPGSVETSLTPWVYTLTNYHRSNQDTYMVHRPLVHEGQWVEKGDSLADSSSSVQGEFSIGQNILVGYTPWEGYNFEDAVLISERVIYDDLYTSLHIERYEIEVRDTQYGMEQITVDLPNQIVNEFGVHPYLDSNGIARLGTWLKEGEVLVGKLTPTGQKKLTPYENLLYDILAKKIPNTRDTSLRVPKGASGRVIHVEIIEDSDPRLKTPDSALLGPNDYFNPKLSSGGRLDAARISTKLQNSLTFAKLKSFGSTTPRATKQSFDELKKTLRSDLNKTSFERRRASLLEKSRFHKSTRLHESILKRKFCSLSNLSTLSKKASKVEFTNSGVSSVGLTKSLSRFRLRSNFTPLLTNLLKKRSEIYQTLFDQTSEKPFLSCFDPLAKGLPGTLCYPTNLRPYEVPLSTDKVVDDATAPVLKENLSKQNNSSKTLSTAKTKGVNARFSGPKKVHIYLAEKRKLQIGDKIAGRHGNKGIISNILPRQDMPYLPDGTPLDIVLNPLGVPSRMNVGQIFECLLGMAGYYLKQNYKIQPFDEIYGCEASRSLVYSKLYEARIKTGQDWLFNPNFPGKTRLFDGRSGECFEQPVTVGVAYILKLVHLVDDKIHARSTGPYSLVTQQPLRGRSKQGGQRVGEMEVWALEGFGAAYILQEILTLKSDDLAGRNRVMVSIINDRDLYCWLPESFRVLVSELKSLCVDITIFKFKTIKSPRTLEMRN